MIVKQLIPANPTFKKTFKKDGENFLNVSEFFYDTIQGEGIYIGQPATFLRLKGCSLSCQYCDSTEVWKYGNPWSFDELFDLIKDNGVDQRLFAGQHLVITGGSPMLQHKRLYEFLNRFYIEFDFLPFVEIENECVISPPTYFAGLVSCWNNSPKLESSKVPFEQRYKPDVIKFMSSLKNSWFKFVISNDKEWEEIENGFLTPGLIEREQIILMPEGATRIELEMHKLVVLEMAIENNVRYSSREHVMIWNKKTGV